MMIKNLKKRLLKNLISNVKSEEKIILFFKGFDEEFFSILHSMDCDKLCNEQYIKIDKSIDIEKLEENKNLLLIKFLQCNNSLTWGYYEELILLANTLQDINNEESYKIIVIKNNLYTNKYPVNLQYELAPKLMNYIEGNEGEDSVLEIYIKYYAEIEKIENQYGVSYNDGSNKYLEKNFYEPIFEVKLEDLNEDAGDTNTVTNLNLFKFKTELEKGYVVKDFSIAINNKEEIKEIEIILFIANELNIKYKVIFNNRFKSNDEIEENKYKFILNKYWREDGEFRKIKFYKNPEEGTEVVELSQGYIISDVVRQIEIALEDKDDFRDIFITAPTGAGKSLLFQIPAINLAIEKNCITIVITPLIALMRDQVEQLKNERNISFATFLNSEISFEERESRVKKIKRGEISIIYMSPELLLSTSLENIVGNRRIGLLVVDEAHIVTTWGRDFRADYWFLGAYIQKIRRKESYKFPIICLTATAVYMGIEDTVNDTINTLALVSPKIYLGNVKRDNIEFDINLIKRKNIIGKLDEFKLELSSKKIVELLNMNKKTIVYCPYTSHIQNLEERIKQEAKEEFGIYYGNYEKIKKIEAQEKFKNSEYKLMICTKAFGMGIDISDIEIVYHFAPTGNLSDYVQEIGRVARKKEIKGLASIDFLENDLRYARVLSSMSSIKQYQLKEVLRKLYSIYSKKKKRNILVSPEAFSYLFGEENLDNKVKTSLLLLEKDLNVQFNTLIVRPKVMFTKNYVNVPRKIEKEFISLYGEYIKKVYDDSKRVLPGYYKNGDITISNTGNIYEVNMSAIWENYFSNLTFPDFKRRFFIGELFKFTNNECRLTARVHLSIIYKKEYDICRELLKEYCNKLSSLFAYFKGKEKFFTKVEFKKEFAKKFSNTYVTKDLGEIILEMFVADGSKNIGFNQNKEKYKFIQMRRNNGNNLEMEYRVMNSNYTTFGSYLIRQMIQCKPNNENNGYTSYIALAKGEKKTDILQLSIILELFGLATYEVIGGKNTEIFIRINDPIKIKRSYEEKYRNKILTDIEKKRKKSQEVLQHFLSKIISNEERWEIIENYFLGNQEYVEEKLNIE